MDDISYFKYALVTSIDVKRTFSIYKNLLSDQRRRSFSFENIKQYYYTIEQNVANHTSQVSHCCCTCSQSCHGSSGCRCYFSYSISYSIVVSRIVHIRGHTSHVARRKSQVARRTSLVARCTSIVTLCKSHVACRTSHIASRTLQVESHESHVTSYFVQVMSRQLHRVNRVSAVASHGSHSSLHTKRLQGNAISQQNEWESTNNAI